MQEMHDNMNMNMNMSMTCTCNIHISYKSIDTYAYNICIWRMHMSYAYAYGLKDTEDFPFIEYTVVVKLTADPSTPSEPHSAMRLVVSIR